MSYLKDREIWLSNVPTGNPPTGYFWKFIQNGRVVVRDSSGNNQIMVATSGSQAITGSLTVTGGITGTATTASYVEYSNVANKPALVSGSSQITYSGLSGIPSGIVSGSAQIASFGIFATTGSNGFNGNQSITGSLTVTGQVVAQTLNVQQVTSSIVFSSGSNIFGNSLANTQQLTGSVGVTGSFTVTTSGTELQVTNTGVNLGNALTDSHIISGSLRVNPNGLFVNGSGNVGIGTTSPDVFSRGDERNVGISVPGASDNLALALNAGGSAGRGAQIYMGQGGTRHFTISSNATETRVGTATSTPLILTTNDTTRLTIAASTGAATFSGNVLVAKSSPTLQLNAPTGTAGEYRLSNSDGTTHWSMYTIIGGGNSQGNWGLYSLGKTGGAGSVIEVTPAGNVGIGTASPDSFNAAADNLVVGTTSGNNGITIAAATNGFSSIYFADGTTGNEAFRGYFEYGHSADYLAFGTAASERMRITSDGNFLVGATNADVGGSVKGAIIRQNGSIVGATNISSPFHYQSPIAADRMNTQGDGLMYGMWRQGIFQAGIGATNASVMTFFTGNNDSMTERMRITSSGNVGIGTSSPEQILHVDGNTIIGAGTSNNFGQRFLQIRGSRGSAGVPAATLFLSQIWNGVSYPAIVEAQQGTIYGNAAADLVFKTSFFSGGVNTVERMRITDGGNVGIGVTSPSERLEVNGSLRLSDGNADGPQLKLASSGFSDWNIDNFSGNLRAYYGSTEYLRLTSGGELLVGSTSAGVGFVNALKIGSYQGYNSDSNSTAISAIRTGGFFGVDGGASSNNQASYTALTANVQWGAANNPGAIFRGYQNTNLAVQISFSGNIANTNGSYGTLASDIRLKENIKQATSKLNDLLRLNVVNFNFIGNEEKHIGFIAQEMQEVFPSFVYQTDTREYNKDGNLIKGFEDTLGVKVGMEFAILVKAIQEQQTLIESLKSRIEILEQ